MNNSLLRIDQLRLSNFRCFEHLELEFHPELTVIVARNGFGKTAVLDAMAIALGTFVGAFDAAKGRHFARSDARRTPSRSSTLFEMEDQYPVSVEASGLVDGCAETWHRTLESARTRSTRAGARGLASFGERLQREVRAFAANPVDGAAPVLLPLIAYYGTGRLYGGEHRVSKAKQERAKLSRTSGYVDCLVSSSHFRAFSGWFERLARSEFEERNNPARLAPIRDALSALQGAVGRTLNPSGWGNLSYKSSGAGIVASHPIHGELPVWWLSDGTRNMIALTADIAHRAIRLNGHLGPDAVRQTPGIALIDEVDMHLHPEWQQSVLGALRAAFPLVQFIVTTHSPQVLSTARRGHIRILDADGHAHIPEEGTFGAESSRLLESIFGVPSRPESVESVQELRRYIALVGDGAATSPEAMELRRRLEADLGSDDPELKLADLRAHQLEFLRNR